MYKFLLVVVAFVCVEGLRDGRCFFNNKPSLARN